MPKLTVDLSEEDLQQIAAAGAGRALSPEALVADWVRDRLVHERERAAGGGWALSPQARRAREQNRSSH